MKSIRLASYLLAATLLTISCNSQGNNDEVIPTSTIPKNIIQTFENQFSGVEQAEWSKEDDLYEVEFKMGDLEYEAAFNSNGETIAIEVKIDRAHLPDAVNEYLDKNYPNTIFEDIEKVTNNNGYFYEIEGEENGKEFELLFDGNGNFLKTVVEKND